jgi:arylsulfatase A-like enzyme
MPRISRRDFLKLSAAFFGGAGLTFMGSLAKSLRGKADSTKPNFIILVLDAMSARNLSLYGYVRRTTPYLERFLNRAAVYHSHYAGGNFTTSGTATLLTGLYPWTHRATALGGIVERSLATSNLFGLLGGDYFRQAFTQNQLAYLLLGQFARDVDNLMSRKAFALQQNAPMIEDAFANDFPVAYYTFADFLGASEFYVDPASLSLGLIDMLSVKQSKIQNTPSFPKGYPYNYHTYFRLEDILAGLSDTLIHFAAGQSPFLAYYHLLPPHSPYNPKKEFLDLFLKDGLTFPKKPFHPLSAMRKPQDRLDRLRLTYDSFIANIDYEVDAFIQRLDQAGVLDNSYLIITSDHGEAFERGEYGHGTPLLYDGVCHVPLIISAPGQTGRRDVTSLTSNADLVPTILSLAGQAIPDHIEGRLLPEFGGRADPDRSVYTVFAQQNSAFLPLTHSVMAMNKGAHRLIYTRGYPGEYTDKVELYNLADDPEELRDLAKDDTVTANRMKAELLDLSDAADRPYRRK